MKVESFVFLGAFGLDFYCLPCLVQIALLKSIKMNKNVFLKHFFQNKSTQSGHLRKVKADL